MAQSDRSPQEPVSTADNGTNPQSIWRRIFGRDNPASEMTDSHAKEQGFHSDDDPRPEPIQRISRKVVPGLPRAQTFKRQQSETRHKLEPVQPTPAERRAVSVDRRHQAPHNGSQTQSEPRISAPDLSNHSFSASPVVPSVPTLALSSLDENIVDSSGDLRLPADVPESHDGSCHGNGHDYVPDTADGYVMTTSQYDAMIHEDLEDKWILNLSMHFRDKSKREKFFVTYREPPTRWRRVTISVDYRNPPEDSLELELAHIKFQRDKIAKIYEAIRESLADIQFYSTVTNLKLETTEGRLHVHVVEDVNEVIHYPSVRTIQHMRCNRVKERDIEFDSHISGFVYKVRVNGEVLIKKEIPGPDTVDEFLYEINALNRLKHSNHVIQFYGVIVDDAEEHVKGLLISHAEQGALIDVIYDQVHPLPWSVRERWARQIVSGLSEIHESGFVQGDFTLSNIVIDDDDNAKIIDINRRGCPVGWEPPEATPLIESNQRISMYIGVKSDIYQLGMVLWAVAMKEDEPEAHGRPLRIGSDVLDVPDWFRRVVNICLSDDPRGRMPALQLLSLFPDPEPESDVDGLYDRPSISVDDGVTRQDYFVDADPSSNGYPRVRTVQPASDWSYVGWGQSYMNSPNGGSDEPFFYPTRGRSPPSPLPSNPGEYDSSKYGHKATAWASTSESARTAPSEYDAETGQKEEKEKEKKSVTPRMSQTSLVDETQAGGVDQLEESRSGGEPAEQRGEAVPDAHNNDGPSNTAQEAVDVELLQGLRLPKDSQMPPHCDAEQSNSSNIPASWRQEGSKALDVAKTLSCVDAAIEEDMETGTEGQPETGHTEPEMTEIDSKNHSAAETDHKKSELDIVDKPESSTDPINNGQSPDGFEGAPETVAKPLSGGPSTEKTEDTVQAVTILDHVEVTAKEAAMQRDDQANKPSRLISEHHTSTGDTACNVHHDLKGVGTKHEPPTENQPQPINDDEFALLIDGDTATDMDNTRSKDTTVTNHAKG